MIIEQETQQIEVTGDFDQGMVFSADTSDPMLFSMLFDRLYTYKIRSVYREVLSNAYDAHRMIDRPDLAIDVHMPSYTEPTLVVRDYGPGMTPEVIKSVFAVCFKSTKRASNKFIGGYGIGAKSPFAYASMFTIESRAAGVKTTYVAFRDETNVPRLSQTASEPCTDTGVSVIIPVNQSDIATFTREINWINQYFTDTTIILENEGVKSEAPKMKYSRTSDSNAWGVRDDPIGDRECRVVMANVAFPVDLAHGELADIRIGGLPLTILNRMGIDLFVENGSIDLAGSRETLAYTQKTINAIIDAASAIVEIEAQAVNDFVAQHKTWWEAFVAISQPLVAVSRNLLDEMYENKGLQYGGRPLKKEISVRDLLDKCNVTGQKSTAFALMLTRTRRYGGETYKLDAWGHHTVTPTMRVMFIPSDKYDGTIESLVSRCRRYGMYHSKQTKAFIAAPEAVLREYFGDPPLTDPSTITIPRTARGGVSGRYDGPPRFRLFDVLEGVETSVDPMSLEEFDVFYMPVDAAFYTHQITTIYSPVAKAAVRVQFNYIAELYRRFISPKLAVVKLKPRHIAKVEELDNWLPFDELIPVLEQQMSSMAVDQIDLDRFAVAHDNELLHTARSAYRVNLLVKQHVTNEEIKATMLKLAEVAKPIESEQVRQLLDRGGSLWFGNKGLPKLTDLRDELTEMYNKYPLLRWVPLDDETIVHVAAYINDNV
jgi:hypothetical protein